MKIVALAGGVGGAKLTDGLAQILAPKNLIVIVNTGDDFEHLGMTICPDLDTVCYTLAGLANPNSWGRQDETFQTLDNLRQLGGPDWFQIGDRDLATHLERTRRLREGQTLSQITRDFCRAWKIPQTVLPMSDQPVRTMVRTAKGELPFQEYFVHQQCEPVVTGFRFAGIESARPAPGTLEAIDQADAVVICPSNPWVSINPILALEGIRPVLERKRVVGVSPIIAGQTVKGPAAKMFAELGIHPSAQAVAEHYGRLLSAFVIDEKDASAAEALGIATSLTDTLMKTRMDRRRVAKVVLDCIQRLA
jgi:LPPG:FO 2-phospho-L-lactate transferase